MISNKNLKKHNLITSREHEKDRYQLNPSNEVCLKTVECFLLFHIRLCPGMTIKMLTDHLSLKTDDTNLALAGLKEKGLVMSQFCAERGQECFYVSNGIENKIKYIILTWRELTGQNNISESDIQTALSIFSAITIAADSSN